jgi:hypothetical protein
VVEDSYRMSFGLNRELSTSMLREAYTQYCKQNSLRAVSEAVFGKACSQMFGPRLRLPEDWDDHEAAHFSGGDGRTSKRRPWGYKVPDAETWQIKLNARLGIRT